MRPTKTLLGAKARQAIHRGIMAVYEPVAASFGPEGMSALIPRTYNRGPRITVDGITIAEQQIPKDPFVKIAADAFKEGCKRTVEKVGDGTTFTVVFAGHLWSLLFKKADEGSVLDKGAGVVTLRRQILASAAKVKEVILKEKAQKASSLEHLERIASISVKDKDLGKDIAAMAWEVGADGYIDVVEGYKGEIETETIRGMRFPAKVPNKAFLNDPSKYQMMIKDCKVLITNQPFDSVSMLPKLAAIFKTNARLAIVAPGFSNDVLTEFFKIMTIVDQETGKRVKRPGLDIFPVLAPALRTEVMEDFAIYCGATLIDRNKSRKLESAKDEDLGFIEKMVVKDTEAKDEAIAIGGMGAQEVKRIKTTPVEKEVEKNGKKKKVVEHTSEDYVTTPIKERIEVLKGQIENTKDDIYKKVLERRIASMASAVGIIRVGSSTNADSLYVKLKVEDAVFACRSALRAGYVAGGGLCAKEIADSDLLEAGDPVKEALKHAYDLIQASVEGGVVINDDIIDPAEAIAYGVEHGASIIANLITVESVTVELDDTFDGEQMIARSIGEVSIALKQHFGLINEGEAEAERERFDAFDRVMMEDKD